MSPAHNEKWRSSTFALMGGTSHTYLGTMQWHRFEGGYCSQNCQWSLCLRSFVILEVSKPFWSQRMAFFLEVDERPESVATVVGIVDGPWKGSF